MQMERASEGGMAKVKPPCFGPRKSVFHVARVEGSLAKGSRESYFSATYQTFRASEIVLVKMEIVSRLLHAGTTPRAESVPLVGL